MIIMALFIPATITISIRNRRNTIKDKHRLSMLMDYVKLCLWINLVTMCIVTYVFKIDGVDITALQSFPFFIKYVVMASVFAFFWTYFTEIIEKYCSVRFTVDEDKKDEKTY